MRCTVHSAAPNPSVNLTRNSAPHWPGMARYAHNALPRQFVMLSHSGYLKRWHYAAKDLRPGIRSLAAFMIKTKRGDREMRPGFGGKGAWKVPERE